MQELPLQILTEVEGLKIAVSHHLPDKNWGRELIHIGEQSDFDRLCEGNDCAVAVLDSALRQDLRAQYAILEIDETGLADVDFRRVAYDVEQELRLARKLHLPYYEISRESLVHGIHHTHNHDLLREISEREGYADEIAAFLKSSRNT